MFIEMKELTGRIVSFYVDGFRRMRLGRTLWAIILIKLLIMFGVLKIFFFPDYLHDNFTNDMERAEHVFTNLTQIPTPK
jgi:TM2 domain-containing membrane protein YozV